MTRSGSPPRWLRVVAPLLRAPARLDRRGLRWALRLCSPYPILVLTHRGRRSGRLYRTPLELLTGSSDGDMFTVPLAGDRADWYRNVLAGGLVEGSCRGRSGALRWRRVPAADARRALDEYRHRHPLYTRVLLSVIARTNGLPATSSADLADALPVLAFRFEAGEEVTP